jgi:hypothetical protein
MNSIGDRFTLIHHINYLRKNLNQAEDKISRLDADLKLLQEVSVRISYLLNEKDKVLNHLLTDVITGLPMDICWDTFQRTQEECNPLLYECLALIQGVLSRKANLDEGMCQISDALLKYLSKKADIEWHRFTILSGGESFESSDEIIRVSFPEVSIWNLPIAAHELGHYVGLQKKDREPIKTMLDNELRNPGKAMLDEKLRNRGKNESEIIMRHFYELFADLFATYTLGPAYAYTCVFLRFSPWMSYRDTDKHPSDAKRICFILGTLEKINDEANELDKPFKDEIKYLKNKWESNLKVAGQLEHLIKDKDPLDGEMSYWHDEMYSIVDYMAKAKYKDMSRAYKIFYNLQENMEPAQILEEKTTLPDIINAAWIYRKRQWERWEKIGNLEKCAREENRRKAMDIEKAISQKALELCRELVKATG